MGNFPRCEWCGQYAREDAHGRCICCGAVLPEPAPTPTFQYVAEDGMRGAPFTRPGLVYNIVTSTACLPLSAGCVGGWLDRGLYA